MTRDKTLLPHGIYDTRKCRMEYIGLHEDHEATWDTYLGWPSHKEILEAMGEGFVCLPLTITYDPPQS